MHVTAIVAAGGRGRRLGAGIPKQLLCLGGRPILQWSVEAFLASPVIERVVAVLPGDMLQAPPGYLRHERVALVAGGERRQDSVASGLEAVSSATDVVVIHDAARPLVDAGLIQRTVEAAAESGAAIAALPARDTVKQCDVAEAGVQGAPFIARTLPRESIFLAQTPQAFRLEVLRQAVRLGREIEATDEAALAERAGHRVRLVEGSTRNIKITTREDLAVAEALLAPGAGAAGGVRVGFGYDLHRLVEGRPLVLGGVVIPFELGLAGHSDADVVCHAVTDALLGAASAGDIGHHFPDTDARWSGARSTDLLRAVVESIGGMGYRAVNVDVTVIAERPKLGPHRPAIVASLAEALGLPAAAVSLKAKTNEGVDATGRGEAMAAHAIVLVESARGGGAS